MNITRKIVTTVNIREESILFAAIDNLTKSGIPRSWNVGNTLHDFMQGVKKIVHIEDMWLVYMCVRVR